MESSQEGTLSTRESFENVFGKTGIRSQDLQSKYEYARIMKKIAAIGMSVWLGLLSVDANAQRPTAPRLFSNKTIVYARVDDTRDLKDKLAQTSTGKMAEDKDLKPILSTFYSTITQLLQGIQQQVGLSVDELLSIPNGELAVALVPTKEAPVFCVMLEAGSEMPAVQLLLDRLDQRMAGRNIDRQSKSVGRIEVIKYPTRSLGYFIDSDVLVFCLSPEYAETLAQIWQASGIDHTPLADNRNFTDILSRCVGTEGERPQVSFYADPVAIAREALKQSPTSFVALTAIKALGLDGFKGIGGSLIFAANEFDSIAHLHMLMETNRQGVLRALRPKSGSTEPEQWVDDTVVSYTTVNWDLQRTIKAVQDIVDTFGGENAFENNFINNANRRLGIDFRKDFMELLNDRLTLVQMVLPEKKINSQSNLIALHMKNPDKLKNEVLPKLFEQLKGTDSRWSTRQESETTVYFLDSKGQSETVRAPQPAFALLGSHVLFSDSLSTILKALETYDGGDNLLAESIEYKLIRDKIKAQLKGQEFSVMSYQRPDEQLKLFYDLANDPQNIQRLEDLSQNNPFLSALVAALKSRKLPPFEQLAKYVVPAGAFMTEEENGLHYTTFSLKRE
jgi:hypothetical protein